MLLQWFCVLFVFAQMFHVRGEPQICPESCGKVDEWCSDVFGGGGVVSSRDCHNNSFECVCNGASSILVKSSADTFVGECAWDSVFEHPNFYGSLCYSHTLRCPSNCSVIDSWRDFCVDDFYCADKPDGSGLVFNCTTCEGRTFSIIGNNASCKKSYSPPIPCNIQTSCNGHGCCRRPDKITDDNYPCVCHANAEDGFWAQPSCAVCDEAYEDAKGKKCTRAKPNIQLFLSSIGNTWTMVMPNMAVLFFYLIIGITRRLCDSDKCFQSSILRMTGLSPVQVARRHQRSVFRSKYIPKRCAQSKCFLNEDRGHRRGPSPY